MKETITLLWQYYPREAIAHIALLVVCAVALMVLMPMTIAAFLPEEECDALEEVGEC